MATELGATRFMFYDQMGEILGNKPSHSSGHMIESSEDTGSEADPYFNEKWLSDAMNVFFFSK